MEHSNEFLRYTGKMIIKSDAMPISEIIRLVAPASHQTYIDQRHRFKGVPIESIPKEVSEEDRDRAREAWEAILEGKPNTREKAVVLVAESSHNVWLRGQKKPDGVKDEDYQAPDPRPNLHDQERAERLVDAFENIGVLEFK